LSPEPTTDDRRRWLRTAAIVVAAEIAIVVLVLGLTPRPSEVELKVRATHATFVYRPTAGNRTTSDPPLLENVLATALTVQSFRSIDVNRATLAYSADKGATWTPLIIGSPVRIEAGDPLATATFMDVWIKNVEGGDTPAIGLAADPKDRNVFTVRVEGTDPRLTTTAVQADVSFQCQMCAVPGMRAGQLGPVVDFRLADSQGADIVVSGRERLTFQPRLGPEGVGPESFRIDGPRFCEARGPEPRSSVLEGSAWFPEVKRTEEVRREDAISLDGVEPFRVSRLALVGHRGRPEEPEQNAIEMTIVGPVRRFGIGRDCLGAGESHQPSYLDYVRHRPLVVSAIAAVTVLTGMAGAYGALRKVFGG
jgi:hypothetical protein